MFIFLIGDPAHDIPIVPVYIGLAWFVQFKRKVHGWLANLRE